ncbi:MAG TPA: hypothetical protein VF490_08905 [Chryseosolibacter sp.]
MNSIRFNDLTIIEKTMLVSGYGVRLLTIDESAHKVHLYELGSHFIQIYQNSKTRMIESITVATYKDLDKFLHKIPLRRFLRKMSE